MMETFSFSVLLAFYKKGGGGGGGGGRCVMVAVGLLCQMASTKLSNQNVGSSA